MSSSSAGPDIVTDFGIRRPFVERKPSAATNIEIDLPLGIQLTGGAELRRAGLTGKGVKVAVIDSGVDATHPGFAGRVVKQTWFRSGTSLTTDDHGTHVAGTIHLMAPEADIYDYRVFGESGDASVDEAINTSILMAVADGCQVINLSLGGAWPNPAMLAAVQYAHSQGVHLVCAAGNSGDGKALTNEISYPANWEECISVAAIAKKEGLPVAYFSSSNPQVDYSGIGVDVVSFKPFGGYQEMSGTSMACPHVAGLITALLTKTENKEVNLRTLLTEKYAIDIGERGVDNLTGIGFLSYLDEPEVEALLPPPSQGGCVIL